MQRRKWDTKTKVLIVLEGLKEECRWLRAWTCPFKLLQAPEDWISYY
jgi:hypothetical protein